MAKRDPLQEAAEDLISRSIGSIDPSMRAKGALLLADTLDERYIEQIAGLIRDPDKRVRAAATRSVIQYGDRAIPLLKELSADNDWKVRYRATEALGLIQTAETVVLLIHLLNDGKDHVRYMAAKGLSRHCSPEATGTLVPLLRDKNIYVRKAVARALGCIGTGEARDALGAVLERELDEGVRQEIRTALNSRDV